ncbi:MAG: alcohol dehydrogenase catalytic domain-containing protein [Microbacterium sp.]|jgi:propanol-preferring alcohol dehydrogenase|uniref:zinc-binding dehydrogenase n=1 Tax=Microbacterium sp. TaxID=51671 RepID=UPI002720FF7C|nr:alcohol dehydrogenase catalytic domain-containing protein [Microbacterium sp.]MDO8381492.1 alcohol dehydrogenase catalytic domain-containing protein [Microbacterium sp.]
MSTKAYAVLEANGPITTIEVDVPPPTGRAVVLEVTHVGVCHTDTHLREGGYNLGNGNLLRLADRGINFPMTMGHEVVGRVVAVGEEVVGCAIGDLRLVYPWIGCGECIHCLAGHDPLCARQASIGVARPGGYAELVSVPDEKYVVDFDGVEPALAATLACSGVTAYSATSKALDAREPTDPIVVVGAGGVGLMAIATLNARGHRNIVAVDVNPANLETARELGATTSVLATGEDSAEAILAAIGGPASGVIDFVGSSSTANSGLDVLGKGGRLILVGLFGGELKAPTVVMTIKMLSVMGSFLGDLQDMREMLALARGGQLPSIPIQRGVLDRESVEGSLSQLVTGGVRGRIVLSPSTASTIVEH